MQRLIKTTLFAFSISLTLTAAACDSGGEAADTKAAAEAGAAPEVAKADSGDAPEAAGEAGEAGEVAEADAPSLDPKVEKAVALANDIAADPGSADSILEAAGLDREAFEAMLYEIAKDPELSQSYAVAREA